MNELQITWFLDRQFTYRRRDKSGKLQTYTGIRGVASYGPAEWPIICRGQGYKRIRPGLAEGEDSSVFRAIKSTMKGVGACLRILNYKGDSRNRVCFHPANRPDQLAGCTAPGLEFDETGVISSRDAMEEIFAAINLAEGEELKIRVLDCHDSTIV